MISKIKRELDAQYEAREKAIKKEREIIPMCARAIKDIHREDVKLAREKAQKVKKLLKEIGAVLAGYPLLKASVLGTSYQEYAELEILLSFLDKKPLPDLPIPSYAYLNGLGDAIGEAKRKGMDLLAESRIDEAKELEKRLEGLYYDYVQLNYPGSIAPNLKRKQDTARKVLNEFHAQIQAYEHLCKL